VALNPEEAAALGGTATLSTHKDGRASRHLLFSILAEDIVYAGFFIATGLFLLIMPLFNESMRPALQGLGAFLLAGGACLVASAAWSLRPETIEMGREVLTVRTGSSVLDIPWAAVRELRCTQVVAHFSIRHVSVHEAVIVRTDSQKFTMQWWRYPLVERVQFFRFAASRLLPRQTPVVDDLGWLPADKASHPAVSSARGREYQLLVKAGGILALLGLIFFVGFFVGVPLLGAIGVALLFIGFMCAVGGWAGQDEEKKKKLRS